MAGNSNEHTSSADIPAPATNFSWHRLTICSGYSWLATGRRLGVVTVSLFLFVSMPALAAERFVATVGLPSGQTIVVAEGDLEARSIGSFSVRLYDAATPGNETTFFLAGLIRSRDGIVEQAVLGDIDRVEPAELVVILRSAGTGGYVSTYAFRIAENQLTEIAAVEGLLPETDAIAALQSKFHPN